MERLADPELLVRLAGEDRGRRRFLKGFFLLTGLGLMLFALAGPRWGSHYQEASQKGVDIMILVDVSPSMLVEDIEPNRLERARREILDFLRVVQGDPHKDHLCFSDNFSIDFSNCFDFSRVFMNRYYLGI